ncbi:MAG: 3-methyl-2-oxobutanoate hydroxymethyltransferase [Actinobacteria bacterium]|jgi:3-methyl-2-oxobutanoate hydroxymethyltransferase|nr:3-methyl-2-oxobutanoate hydroxymethyltransferase [Actinomycetota bacterium]NCW35034.1 3-methyl-2-oxobutanoate hydroxymethyltransferase [Actinomycetota bacterium]NCZ73187.1 3-methyl-2-oxobutanoate hydroxymethyltransferase [Actinomycetota bacterium]NDA41502.1 3-methyl-2-oxobutanoate hydroxymethyltransferase [Actinomycetota bacterium]NDB31354.1 3-methyl-2-oxobutanoate hydroxymethyltransferase [Actinomycetota bacterium]
MMARFTIADLAAWKKAGKKWAMLTSYDSLTASIFDGAGIPVLLVGDSAGNNFLGQQNTIPVTTDELIPLARAVVRGSSKALVVADLPFGSYEVSKEQALETGIRFLKESECQAVKLEGGVRVIEQIRSLVTYGIPVMGHIGMTPQSVNAFGGFKVQGRNEAGDAILADAIALEEAGCFAVVLELVPADLAERITSALSIPTVGIGAGPKCDAQVLVWNDMMGLTEKPPRFARKYRNLRDEMTAAVREWIADVDSGAFPSESETFH